ncbi:hypothetical protein CR970_01910 [Candidatus Saccharibacteria bacterium]|nr:MAG: hypothetical protein CR970_01910 [Candidatus Saccharibacteria bacterium]
MQGLLRVLHVETSAASGLAHDASDDTQSNQIPPKARDTSVKPGADQSQAASPVKGGGGFRAVIGRLQRTRVGRTAGGGWSRASAGLLSVLRPLRGSRAVVAGAVATAGLLTLGAGWQGVAYARQAVDLPSVLVHDYDQPIRIAFNRPVKDSMQYHWSDNTPGDWRVERSLGGVKTLTFVPAEPLVPGSSMTLHVSALQPVADLGSSTDEEQQMLVKVRAAADVASVSPQEGAQDVAVDAGLSITLRGKNRGLRDLRLQTDIALRSATPESTDDTTFTWYPAEPLAQGVDYRAEVLDMRQPAGQQQIGVVAFRTVAMPQVAYDGPTVVRPGSVIALAFDTPMQQDGVRSDIPGQGKWVSAQRYELTVGEAEVHHSYSITATQGMRSEAGGVLTEDKSFGVVTPGVVQVVGMSPGGSRVALDTPIRLTFNQPVDHASAERAFSLSPHVDGSFSWSGDTLIYSPSGYGYQTTYTVAIAAGVQPTFGLPGAAWSGSFTTTYVVRKLAVPFYRQVHSLSCESASLRMALGHYGVHIVDDDVMALVGGSKGPRNTATNTWDDPYHTFVGSVDGSMGTTGWGVYSGPIAAASHSLGRPATAIGGGVTAEQVAAAIHNGNPVVLWGVGGMRAIEDSWNTHSGGVVRAPRNEHVRVVYGVEGSSDRPIGFYIYDPLGSAGGFYWTANQLRTNSAAGGGHAVIVH